MPEAGKGRRLDSYLASLGGELADVSRSAFKGLIEQNLVQVNGKPCKPKQRLAPGDRIAVTLPEPEPVEIIPEKIDFPILYEDESLLVLSKPPGLVVHPACGNYTGTLVHGLMHHCRDLGGINGSLRPGIVHRLDKFTSGAMVVAKNDAGYHSLVRQFKDKQVRKVYRALLDGTPDASSGRIVSRIGRHPVHRKKMAVVERGGKEAVTNWRLLTRMGPFSYVEIVLETGRTHQIRVHMAHAGMPVAGDEVYGRKNRDYGQFAISRQCLHAMELGFSHPESGSPMSFTAPLWPDMQQTLSLLEARDGAG